MGDLDSFEIASLRASSSGADHLSHTFDPLLLSKQVSSVAVDGAIDVTYK